MFLSVPSKYNYLAEGFSICLLRIGCILYVMDLTEFSQQNCHAVIPGYVMDTSLWGSNKTSVEEKCNPLLSDEVQPV